MANVLPLSRQAEVFAHLMEGAGVRAASRLTDVSQPTVLRLLLAIGQGYDRVHDRLVRGLSIEHIEGDELHSYVKVREKNLPEVHDDAIGEQWVYLASAKTAKLVVSYRVGKRTQETTDAFLADLRARLVTIPVLSTDAYPGYPRAVGAAFTDIDYAQVVKSFNGGKRGRLKSDGPGMTKRTIWGAPNLDECSTSHAERLNLSFRTQLRRLVRRGTGASKTLAHHRASISAYVGFFNFCRVHMALRVTPAMQSGITDHVWSAEEFVAACLSEPEGEAPSPQPLTPRPGAPGASRKTSTGVWLRAVPTPGSKPAPTPAAMAERQGDLFAWAAAHPEKTAQSEPSAVKPSKPLPPKGTQLKLFDDET